MYIKALFISGDFSDIWIMANKEGNLQRIKNKDFMKRISSPHINPFELRVISDEEILLKDEKHFDKMMQLPLNSPYMSETAYESFKILWGKAKSYP